MKGILWKIKNRLHQKIKLFFYKNFPVKLEENIFLNRKEYNTFLKLEVSFEKAVTINLEELNFEKSIDFDSVSKVFFTDGETVNRNIIFSPHYKLIKLYQKIGDIDLIIKDLESTDYYKFFMSFNKIGQKTNLIDPQQKHIVNYERADIEDKVRKFIELYDFIMKEGYLSGRFKGNYICVLQQPFSLSRFQVPYNDKFSGYEIISGHHRASILAALGFMKVNVLLMKDNHPGKHSIKKL
ncbi:hypothetical protein N9N67_06450 [Bacteriovoracaceae bacterium]|nr:hypothetical protein [Bacteriovoracaceae bacterium]